MIIIIIIIINNINNINKMCDPKINLCERMILEKKKMLQNIFQMG